MLDIANRQFGRLTAIWTVGKKGGLVYWICLCRCGSLRIISVSSLTLGRTRSCGCLRKESAFKHGYIQRGDGTIYKVYKSMIARCTVPTNKDYSYYGGRGIIVCDRWLCSFDLFLLDLGPRPVGMSLERKDNNKGYSPDNCCWATKSQQMLNRRKYTHAR